MTHAVAESDWWLTPRGQYVLGWEQHELDRLVADLFGYYAVQIGMPNVDCLRSNRIPQRFVCALGSSPVALASVSASSDELPFAAQSVDLVVLPHVLEFAPHPNLLLREVERILMPEGSVVVVGFNPWSLWGMRRAFSGHKGALPWQGQYLSVQRLKDWLSLLGCVPQSVQYGAFAPPVAQSCNLQSWGFMDVLGSRLLPIVGGVFILHAIKRVQGMRLIRPSWQRKEARQRRLVSVTQHQPAELNRPVERMEQQ